MTAPVPQAAVDAAMKAMGCVKTPIGLCASVTHNGARLDVNGNCTFAAPVAAAVVAAVQGPIKAEALREAADEFDEFVDVDEPTVQVIDPKAVRHKIANTLRGAADLLEAQP